MAKDDAPQEDLANGLLVIDEDAPGSGHLISRATIEGWKFLGYSERRPYVGVYGRPTPFEAS